MESNKEKLYTDRLKNLVDMVLPLLKESDNIYPVVKKYKRTTSLTKELNDSLNKIFGDGDSGLVTGQKYIYDPDIYTIGTYKFSYAGKVVTLTGLGRSPDGKNCDSHNPDKCNYLITLQVPYIGKVEFWTKLSNLKPIKNKY